MSTTNPGIDAMIALAREDIRALEPYKNASWEPAFTRLHANESPWPPAFDTAAAISAKPTKCWARPTTTPASSVRARRRPAGRASRYPCSFPGHGGPFFPGRAGTQHSCALMDV